MFDPAILLSQFYATICQSESTEGLGLGPGSPLVTSLKQRVVSLASNVGVINTVQLAAQNALQSGWSILLPTAEERARTLSTLLSNEGMTLDQALWPQNLISVVFLQNYYIAKKVRLRSKVTSKFYGSRARASCSETLRDRVLVFFSSSDF